VCVLEKIQERCERGQRKKKRGCKVAAPTKTVALDMQLASNARQRIGWYLAVSC
jgi:hypothetical protein